MKIGVLASGRGSNLQAIIDACESGKISAEVKAVISDRKEAYALKRAEMHKIPHYFVDIKKFKSKAHYEEEVLRLLKKHGVQLVCLAGYMRLVGEVLLKAYPMSIINIHPSLLPAFPGLNAQKQAIEYGVKVSGCTVHFVDQGMDTGPIILQSAVQVFENDTEETLAKRILEQEHVIYLKAIELFSKGKLKIEGRRVKILE